MEKGTIWLLLQLPVRVSLGANNNGLKNRTDCYLVSKKSHRVGCKIS